jgi:AcrR family transcriptional regulator
MFNSSGGKMENLETPSPNARQRSQKETWNRLLESSARLFAEKGSKNTRTADIAKDAQVAVGTVYLHFKDKDALLKEVLKIALTRLKQEIAKYPTSGDTMIKDKMEALASFTIHFPELARVLFDGSNLSTTPGKEAMAFLVQSQEKGLIEGVAMGYYRGDLHPGLAARAMVGSFVTVLNWWAQNPEVISQDEVVRSLTSLRMEGLSPRF